MGVDAFVKFCKIGALSATGTRPFDAGADGFVMGEGAALFVLKRLEDAERDGDRIYAVLLGLGGSSDGKGKGITAPNPVGQRLAVERAWEQRRGSTRSTAGAVEAHGTSTRVGDAAELASLAEVFGAARALPRARSPSARSSPTSATSRPPPAPPACSRWCVSLHEKLLPPSLHFVDPNPNVDWDTLPFAVNTELRDWPQPADDVRRGGRQRLRLRRHELPRRPRGARPRSPPPAGEELRVRRHPGVTTTAADVGRRPAPRAAGGKAPLRGALVLGGRDDADLAAQVAGCPRAGPRRGHAPAHRSGPGAGLGAPSGSPSTTPTPPTSPTKPDKARQRASPRATPRRCGCCAHRASSSAGAPRPRSPSSTPGRARSTSTCSSPCAPRSRSSRRPSPRRTGS